MQKNRLLLGAAILELLALSLWVGTMTGFAFIFAPTAFHSIGNLGTFAALISKTVKLIDDCGAVLGTGALLLSFTDRNSRLRLGRQLAVGAMLAGTGIEHFAILPQMDRALGAVGGDFQLPSSAAKRLAYDNLHHASSTVYGVVVISGFVALILRAITLSRYATATDPTVSQPGRNDKHNGGA